ncbi:acyl-CoA dehydrogenase [Janthinobacterium sp. NKUCC06_STL]|uniref:acyl-CoA dehydrogenase n=1 Tax=Janthinobacterium sp. NKUCC06_STL TaxID=2842127 RepID=UPI001C5B20A9|nr:acyl-CoA dehydrogenase [Janthinobacterium sp. NKUCC06_STL]MBW3507899.1 acyl-CoA dehydrogenase [Janthinobacterium sp. NKUCC06_STL]
MSQRTFPLPSHAALDTLLQPQDNAFHPLEGLRRLRDAGLDQLPLPGHGATLRRWQMLAAIAAVDLSLLKLYEGHTDALAIQAEIGGSGVPAGSSWGVWCTDMPGTRVRVRQTAEGRHVLDGRKAWCAGAQGLSHALISCWNDAGQACLASVAVSQPGVHVTNEGWQAVGMHACASVDVTFSAARAYPVGAPGAYLQRPGFWHGGAGIAAAWYGAACAVASHLHARAQHAAPDPVRLAQLGQIDYVLRATGALLREGAAEIDRHPQRDAMGLALRLRLATEDAATLVLHLATRALGASPLCRDARFARLVADLPVFLRQSHAERDQAVLGGMVAGAEDHPWTL